MPRKPEHPCPSCRSVMVSSMNVLEVCRACKLERRKVSDARYQRVRPDYGYSSSTWRKIAAERMSRAGNRCERCGALAQDVDHIVPLRSGGEHSIENTRALCRPCHATLEADRRRADSVGVGYGTCK